MRAVALGEPQPVVASQPVTVSKPVQPGTQPPESPQLKQQRGEGTFSRVATHGHML